MSHPDADVGFRAMDDSIRFAVAPITEVDVRDSSEHSGYWTMSGYAAVFDQTTTLYDGRFMKLTESIAPKFFDRVLREQPLDGPDGVVHFNLGHDMNRSVAATDVPAGQPGSLTLKADSFGLGFLAKVPKDDPDGVALAAKMRSGVIRQASFAFSVAKDEIVIQENDDGGPEVEHRTLLECRHLYDVCATPQGAYSQTISGLRSLAAALGQPVTGGLEAVSRFVTSASSSTSGNVGIVPLTTTSTTTLAPYVTVGGGVAVSPAEGGGDEHRSPASEEYREKLRLEIARKVHLRRGFPDRRV